MKEVLFVVDERQMGGVSIALENILNNIDLSNFDIDILVLHNNGDRLSNIPSGVDLIYGGNFFQTVDLPISKVLKIKKIRLIFNKLKLVFYMKTGLIKNKIIKQREKILKKDYDIEIAFKDGFCALFTAYGSVSKKVHWLHSYYDKDNPNKKYDKIFKNLFNSFDEIVAVSKPVLDSFLKIYDYENNAKVIPNIIEQDEIIKKGQEECLDIKKSDITFISVGRLHKLKGYSRLIDVFYMLKGENLLDNVVLNIVGNGDEYNLLTKKIKDLGLENNIGLLGEKTNPYKYINNSDIFIVSSYSESFCLVAVESLILGKPVIFTDIPAIFELVNDGKNGLMTENSLDGLYDGLKEIIINKRLFNKLKKNSSNYNYDNNKIILEINDVLGGNHDC